MGTFPKTPIQRTKNNINMNEQSNKTTPHPEKDWTCDECTYVNTLDVNECKMCGESRRVDILQLFLENMCSEEKNITASKRKCKLVKPKKKATITNNGIKNDILDKPKKKIITSSKSKSTNTDNEPNTWSC